MLSREWGIILIKLLFCPEYRIRRLFIGTFMIKSVFCIENIKVKNKIDKRQGISK